MLDPTHLNLDLWLFVVCYYYYTKQVSYALFKNMHWDDELCPVVLYVILCREQM